jgi:hypothetical protein
MKRLLIVLMTVLIAGCAVSKEKSVEPFISKLNWDKWDPEHKHCPKSIYDVKWDPTYMYDYLQGFGDLQITPEKFIWSYSGEFTYEYAGSKDGKDYFILDGIPLSPDKYSTGAKYIAVELEYSGLYYKPKCYLDIVFHDVNEKNIRDINKWKWNGSSGYE